MSSRTAARAFRPDIQGMRAIAVTAVVLNHAGVPGAGGGYVGVDVFFVISGFLITGHLAGRLEARGRIDFAEFYARRVRRILPASFTVLALSIAGALTLVAPALRPRTLQDALAVAVYLPNYVFAARGTDYLADPTPSLFQHYWSLGVEEQFYLVWPALLAAVWLLCRRSLRTRRQRSAALACSLLAVVIVSFALELHETGRAQPWAFFSLWTRAWELALGGLVAVATPAVPRRLPEPLAAGLGWAALAGIVAACATFSSTTPFPGAAALLPAVSATVLIACAPAAPRFGPVRLLRLRPFQFIGLISYSLYLVHWPLLQLGHDALGPAHPLALRCAVLLAAVPLAWLLYRLVEDPMRSAPVLARPRRTLLAALGGSAVLASAALVAIAVAGTVPLSLDRAVARTAPAEPPVATPFVPSNLNPSLADAPADNPMLYTDGCELGFSASQPHPCSFGPDGAPRIVLWGDSAAAQWAPGLERTALSAGYQLVTQTKSGCASSLITHLRDGEPYTSCDEWRSGVLAQLAADPPAILVIANYDGEEVPADADAAWAAGLADTISRVPASTRVVLLADSPDLRTSPISCLSQHLADATACARPASVALRAPGRVPVERAAASTRATLIDLTGYFCTDVCLPIIGGALAYRDSHHLTATFSAELADALSARLAPLLQG